MNKGQTVYEELKDGWRSTGEFIIEIANLTTKYSRATFYTFPVIASVSSAISLPRISLRTPDPMVKRITKIGS